MEHYSWTSEAGNGATKVTRVPDQKTVFVEQIGGVGRALMMDKAQVDGITYRAGYSSRNETVYISLAAQALTANHMGRWSRIFGDKRRKDCGKPDHLPSMPENDDEQSGR